MAYSTAANVRARLHGLPAAAADTLVDAAISDGIEYADGQIDGRLRKAGFTVPLSPVPVLVKHVSADLAAAFVLDASFSAGGEDKETALSTTIRARALALLEQIAEGEIDIGVTSGATSAMGFQALHTRYEDGGRAATLEDFDLINPPDANLPWPAS